MHGPYPTVSRMYFFFRLKTIGTRQNGGNETNPVRGSARSAQKSELRDRRALFPRRVYAAGARPSPRDHRARGASSVSVALEPRVIARRVSTARDRHRRCSSPLRGFGQASKTRRADTPDPPLSTLHRQDQTVHNAQEASCQWSQQARRRAWSRECPPLVARPRNSARDRGNPSLGLWEIPRDGRDVDRDPATRVDVSTSPNRSRVVSRTSRPRARPRMTPLAARRRPRPRAPHDFSTARVGARATSQFHPADGWNPAEAAAAKHRRARSPPTSIDRQPASSPADPAFPSRARLPSSSTGTVR